jgi:hypothetical protein
LKLPVLDTVKIVLTNAVGLILIWAVYQDFMSRIAYFHQLGFSPHTTYYPFFYIMSVTNANPPIPGILTLDWIQVVAAILVVADAFFAVGLWRRMGLQKGALTPPAEL